MRNYDFDTLTLQVFKYQSRHNQTYREFLDLIHVDVTQIDELRDIPFCPISVFKSGSVKTNQWEDTGYYFLSSGTGGDRSRHDIKDLSKYHLNCQSIFENHFGRLKDIQVVGLLPHYSDNPHSSLLAMVEYFMNCSQYKGQYFLNDLDALADMIEDNKGHGIRTMVIGVSFALLDYAHKYKHQLNEDFIIIETGGMKRYRREMTKGEMHSIISDCFDGALICSEYGMTECLSQAYSYNDTNLMINDSFKVVITDPIDPGVILPNGKTGRINIIDLANIDALSFIATDDVGKINSSHPTKFEVIGRLSSTDLRGCNHLI